jgi:uncharacterized protein YbjT (DUF2867 family)
VLLTGASGYIGSVVLEQLLRTTDVGAVYLLLRGRRGADPSERVRTLLQSSLFHMVRARARAPELAAAHKLTGTCMLVTAADSLGPSPGTAKTRAGGRDARFLDNGGMPVRPSSGLALPIPPARHRAAHPLPNLPPLSPPLRRRSATAARPWAR